MAYPVLSGKAGEFVVNSKREPNFSIKLIVCLTGPCDIESVVSMEHEDNHNRYIETSFREQMLGQPIKGDRDPSQARQKIMRLIT